MSESHAIYTNIIDFEVNLVGLAEKYTLIWIHVNNFEALPAFFHAQPILAIKAFVDPVHTTLTAKQRRKGNYLVLMPHQTTARLSTQSIEVTPIPFTKTVLSDYRVTDTDLLFLLLQQKQCLVNNNQLNNPNPFSRLIFALSSWEKGQYQPTIEVNVTHNHELILIGHTYTRKTSISKNQWSFNVEPGTRTLYAAKPGQGELIDQNTGDRQHVGFLSIKEEDRFNDSKVGLIHELIKWLGSRRFTSCFNRKPALRPYPLSQYSGAKMALIADQSYQLVKRQTINFYADQDAASQYLTQRLVNAINMSPVAQQLALSAEWGTKMQPGLNVQVIRDARNDPHKIDGYQVAGQQCVLQHVTVDNFGKQQKNLDKSDEDVLSQKNHAMTKVLQELMIKQDISLRQLRMVPQEELVHITPYEYYTFKWSTPRKTPKDDWFVTVSQLRITADGQLLFDQAKMSFKTATADDVNPLKRTGFQVWQPDSRFHQVQGALKRGDRLFVIYDTPLMTLPAIDDVHRYLAHARPQRQIYRQQLLTVAREMKVADKYRASQRQLVAVLESETTERLTVAETEVCLKAGGFKWTNKAMVCLNEDTHQRLGIWLHVPLRKKAYVSYWIGFQGLGLLSIHGMPHYFVASQTALKENFDKAIRLKRIEVLGDTNGNTMSVVQQSFSDFQRMMQVAFVRNGQATVIPFPLKYLREFEKLN